MAEAFETVGLERSDRDKNSRVVRSYYAHLDTINPDVNDDLARNLIEAQAPNSFRGLFLDAIDVTEIGPTEYEGRATYVHPAKKTTSRGNQENVFRLTFDTSGATQHITHGTPVSSHDNNAAGGFGTDWGGAINVQKTENELPTVNGTDILVPTLRFSFSTLLRGSTVTGRYVKQLSDATGHMNSTPFFSFDRGEVLFLGATGQQRDDGDFDATFNFDASANQTNLTFGSPKTGIVTVPEKLGWDFLWVHSQPNLQPGSKGSDQDATTILIVQVDVVRVYDFADLNQVITP